VDAADQCPQVAETFNDFQDADGCPDVANDLDGDGVSDETDDCPREPEVVNGVRDWDGCPEDPVVLEAEAQAVEQLVIVARGTTDPDGDGITGPADHCADVPEDFDNFEDDDGCPEADNDLDGIPDATDLCKLVAETVNGVEDTDGCPDLANDLDGDGVDDNQDLCPREPETLNGVRDWDGCPEDPVVLAASSAAGRRVGVNVGGGAPSGGGADTERDGIGDAFDACPTVAEDADGFEDGDGCPDPDNDADGVPDVDDACPRVAEVMNHFNDDDGCPDEVPEETKGLAGAVDAIEFESNSARLRKSSIATLERIADVMKKNPRLLLEVAGHTDDRGRRWWNVWLSEQRAKSVISWLRRAGVPSDRITSKGFGPEKPRDSNDTPEGRARNRRVELTFTERRESK
jgi:outer membrane protein OmpA-like peptidoglycan-associated protein